MKSRVNIVRKRVRNRLVIMALYTVYINHPEYAHEGLNLRESKEHY